MTMIKVHGKDTRLGKTSDVLFPLSPPGGPTLGGGGFSCDLAKGTYLPTHNFVVGMDFVAARGGVVANAFLQEKKNTFVPTYLPSLCNFSNDIKHRQKGGGVAHHANSNSDSDSNSNSDDHHHCKTFLREVLWRSQTTNQNPPFLFSLGDLVSM